MNEDRTEAMIAAIWRAVARSMVPSEIARAIYPHERKEAIRVAEHVEAMLRVTAQLWNNAPTA